MVNSKKFRRLIFEFYAEHGRNLPWRLPEKNGYFDPYKILVSELMLQQTQVERVIPKYQQFLHAFPDLSRLAEAHFQQVLQQWSGLGYNRRAKFLHEIAKELKGKPFPKSPEELVTFKGIGANTAAAVLVYGFNQRQLFIETNVRTVLIHHYYPGVDQMTDTQLLEKLDKVLLKKGIDCRTFYWGLMDYGSYLKRSGVRNNTQSKSYRRQTAFSGSVRQLRGQVLQLLTDIPAIRQTDLKKAITDERLELVLEQLDREDLIWREGKIVHLRS